MLSRNPERAKRRQAEAAAEKDRAKAARRTTLMATVGRAATMGPATTTAAPKGQQTKPGKRAPTVAERAWMDAIVAHGCVACRLDGHAPRPAAVHHILSGGQRIGHLHTLPLCDPGHHQGGSALGLTSRHPYRARFEAQYGTEAELLARLRITINQGTMP